MASTTDPMIDGLDPVERDALLRTLEENPEIMNLPQDLQRDALDEVIDAVRAQRDAARAVVAELERSRDRIVKDRLPIESRWAQDINQYEGESLIPASKEHATETGDRETHPKINLTRARTNMAAARIADMLFPANDRNWDVQPLNDRIAASLSEVSAGQQAAEDQGGQPSGQPGAPGQPPVQAAMSPQDMPQQGPDGAPLPPGVASPAGILPQHEAGRDDQPSEKDRCDAMREQISNQLKQSGYSGHGRRIIEDGCKIGIGVMKGPFTRLVKRKRFGFKKTHDGRTVALLDIVEERLPQCTRVDPRFFYPESVRNMDECERAFELHLMSRNEVKELAAQDGIDKAAAEMLLEKTPQLGRVGINLSKWNTKCVLRESTHDKYAVWEMHGILTKMELEALGLDDLDTVDMIPVAEVWFCQGEVLRVSLSVLEADLRPPYWVWNYERADDTIYGYGIPWLYRNSQRSIDTLWLMLMHNLSVSSGPQVFIRDGIVKPYDGKYVIRGPKLWRVISDDVDDARKAFASETLDNNAAQITDVLKLTMELGDDEIALPSIAQGQPNEAVPTAAGLIQLLNASNIVQRRCAKSMDDEVIAPMIERFYVWNMLHGNDDNIKGDFAVAARGTSVLLHKDIKAQHLQIIGQIVMSNPELAVYLKQGEFLREMFDAADVSTTLLLRTDQEAAEIRKQNAASQGQGPSQADQAKAKALLAEVEIKRQRLENEQRDSEMARQVDQRKQAIEHEQFMANLQDKAEDRRAKLILKQAELQIMAARLADNRDISLAAIEKDLHISDTNAKLKEFLGTMDARLKAAGVANAQREMALKLDPNNVTHTGI